VKVIIVDDEPIARRVLREYCATEPDVEIIGEFGDGRAALAAIRIQPPDLLFLDIHMDAMNGLVLARELGGAGAPHIVFVTAYDDHALEAFEVCAVDYLLKPFDEERFRRTVERVRRLCAGVGADAVAESAADVPGALRMLLQRLEAGTLGQAGLRPRLLAESGGHMHVLDVGQIELIEADRNYVRVTVGRDSYQARSTLQGAEQAMSTQPMLRISRSCLVNMNHLREISRTPRGDFILVLTGGSTVTSSEGFRERVREQLNRLRLGPG
jgi:two-component system LytT family response regulator